MDLKEALNAVREMAKFFEGFRRIEEIIEAGAHLDENIKSLEAVRGKLESDIKDLTGKKAALNKAYEDLSQETKERIVKKKADLAAEFKAMKEEFDKNISDLIDKRKVFTQAMLEAEMEHKQFMQKISEETDQAKKTLISVKADLEKIKGKL